VKTATAVIAGAVLFTLPFQLYLHGGAHPGDRAGAHADHGARHGGTLVMVEDHHLEIVARNGHVEVYVTDAMRRPVKPSGGSVVFDDGRTGTLVWRSYRLVVDAPPAFAWGDYEVKLNDGTSLAIRVPAVAKPVAMIGM